MSLGDIPGWLTPVFTAIIGAFSGLLIGKRKRNADADSVIVESARKIIDEWEKLKKQKDQENTLLLNEIKSLKERVEVLERDLELEKEALSKSKVKIAALESERDVLKARVDGAIGH